ncbi:MAG: porin [Planctomycetes bacterium]|uniref:porin n=1 Tax=Candidatus Wunengus californicus TaxID=3367619 RepID=UPI004027C3FB|nr:porin [Planctomycetota bacterium]MBI4222889.1 porin [Planctomycetota bacterium]
MSRKWCKYVLTSAVVVCGIYAGSMKQGVFAQEAAQPKKIAEGEMEDLKWQLKQMEEGVKRQQEQIQAINNRLNAMNASVEDVKKIGSTAQEPDDFRVYWKEGLNFDTINKNFKLKIGGRIQQDWGWFREDKEIRDTIGDQVDGAEFRRARIYLSGTIYNNIDFKMEYDFAGGGRPSFTDVFVELKEIPVVGNFKVGHFKEPFSLEELTSSNYITFMERSLPNVFAPARNTGMMLHNTLADKRMTWATGVFRNADDFGDSEGNESTEGGYSFSGRLTGLPWYEEEGRKLLHTGIGYSYQNAFQNEIRYRQRPEMGMADRFVDTGTIKDAEATHLFGPELALVYGPFSLQTEYIFANVDLEDGGGSDPEFSGFYVYGSYFLTGENRRYSTKSGSFDMVKPKKIFKWGESLGAIELAARYSALDLADEAISGGRLQDTTVGVNWYLNPNMRIMLNYVHSEADVSGKDGSADLVGMRFNIFF